MSARVKLRFKGSGIRVQGLGSISALFVSAKMKLESVAKLSNKGSMLHMNILIHRHICIL